MLGPSLHMKKNESTPMGVYAITRLAGGDNHTNLSVLVAGAIPCLFHRRLI